MAKFDDFLEALREGVKQLAGQAIQDYRAAGIKDGQAFLRKTRADLERWTKALAKGQLSKADFEWLLRGKQDLAVMEALKQQGLALVEVDKFRGSLIDLVVNTAFKVFL